MRRERRNRLGLYSAIIALTGVLYLVLAILFYQKAMAGILIAEAVSLPTIGNVAAMWKGSEEDKLQVRIWTSVAIAGSLATLVLQEHSNADSNGDGMLNEAEGRAYTQNTDRLGRCSVYSMELDSAIQLLIDNAVTGGKDQTLPWASWVVVSVEKTCTSWGG